MDDLNIAVCVVTFDADWMARAFAEQMGFDWPVLLDAERELYRRYGFTRGSVWAIYNPLSILKYIQLLATEQKLARPGSDLHQLGGNVLVDPMGIVRLHYASASPHDRPSVDEILRLVSSYR